MLRTTSAIIASAACALSALAAQPTIFQPDSATAGSEFSGSYDIGNAIDLSGMSDLCVTASHSTYVQNNHWTTKAGAINAGTAFANFFFDEDTTIGSFLLWNHRSDGVAADPGYAVTSFDLRLYDVGDNVLYESLSTPALPNTPTVQTYNFAPVDGVRRVEFVVLTNNGSPNYTGVAEVAFAQTATCPGDLNADQSVDSQDLNALLGSFGTGDGGDLNCDGATDSTDLNLLLGLFGSACSN